MCGWVFGISGESSGSEGGFEVPRGDLGVDWVSGSGSEALSVGVGRAGPAFRAGTHLVAGRAGGQ